MAITSTSTIEELDAELTRLRGILTMRPMPYTEAHVRKRINRCLDLRFAAMTLPTPRGASNA